MRLEKRLAPLHAWETSDWKSDVVLKRLMAVLYFIKLRVSEIYANAWLSEILFAVHIEDKYIC